MASGSQSSSSSNNNNTPLRHRSNNNTTNHESSSSTSPSQNAISSLDRIDVDSLRRLFGEEDFTKHKPHELRELWMERVKDDDVPPFLLDPKDKHHVAPHVMAMQLLLKRRSHKSGNDGLYYDRVPTTTNDEEHNPRQNRHAASIPRVFLVPLAVIALIGATCQFVLEVLGGAGAIWGCAEVVGLRTGVPLHESWTYFQKLALGVGFACLVRFVLVHCLRLASSPTFVQAHKISALNQQHKGSLFLFLEMAILVAKDPILFLHPAKGPILSCFGCVCVCCGTRCGVSRQDDDIELGSPSSRPSPQHSTWSLSPDEDNDNAMDRV